MLQLKKQQLQSEIALIVAKTQAVIDEENAAREGLERWVGLLATDETVCEGLVKVDEIEVGDSNIAGVPIPTFERISTTLKKIDKWDSPAWADEAQDVIQKIMSLQAERKVFEEQRRLVTRELQLTSQRVNLFEKVKIPDCKEAIRVIKIALGDEQTAAVTRGKIAKSRTPAQ
mgnify:FL=1